MKKLKTPHAPSTKPRSEKQLQNDLKLRHKQHRFSHGSTTILETDETCDPDWDNGEFITRAMRDN